MKLTIKTTILLFTTSLFLISCNLKKENTTIFEDNPRVDLLTLDNGKEVIVRKDYYGTYSFNNWNTYNMANIEIHRIEEADYEIAKNRFLNLNTEISNLQQTIPNWLKTKEVMGKIAEVKTEYDGLMQLKDKPLKSVKERWEEFTEKFNDLREELSETVNEFQA